ncbi:MAG: zinc-ribbon domain-containing protein [Candidatus Hodarchaeales archaeon]|jgi:DNA repair exonuclease SbcCD ATPase subunit
MSQTTYCSNCGKNINTKARFCRFCGNPVKKSRSAISRSESTPPSPIKPPTPARKPLIPTTEVVEKIPEEIINNLYARKRESQIKADLKKLLDEIDELTKKVEIGLIEQDNSAEMISKIQSNIDTLQEEQKSLKSQPLDLEDFAENEKKWQRRLEKIEEKKRVQAISHEVYSSLHDEYASELASIQQKLAVEERKARRWLVGLQKDARELDTKIERLKVRGEIEGMNTSEISQKTEDLSKQRKKKAVASEVLTEILSTL